jgi:hypothetical protein
MNFKSIKEDQKNFRSNTYKYSVPLQVKRKISAINTGIEYLLNRVYTVPKICENYVSYDEFIQVISEAIAERIYLYFFSDLDDQGEEWGEIYNGIMKYVDIVWGDRLESYFEKNCSKGEIIKENAEKITKLINSLGLFRAAKFVGGYDTLIKLMGKNNIPKDIKVEAIKEFIEGFGGIDFSEINGDPIPYGESNNEYREITYLGTIRVIVYVWGGYNNDTHQGKFGVRYEDLPEKILDDIINILMDEGEFNI